MAESPGEETLEESEYREANRSVREESVGITEFLNPTFRGFSGIIKHRCSDFQVFEIGLDGATVRLSDMLMDPHLERLVDDASSGTKGCRSDDVDLRQVKEALRDVIEDDSFFAALPSLLQHHPAPAEGQEHAKDETPHLLTPILPDKTSRTTVHQVIRTLFRGMLQTQAQEDGSIRIYHYGREQGKGRDDRNRRPVDQCKFLAFHLYKENMDTIEAIQLIARRLHMNSRDFSYAGMKDRRGITVQRVVARNVTPRKILGINKLVLGDGKRLAVSNIQVATGPLNLGDLRGNRFELVIRDLGGASDGEIEREMEFFQARGFINYFGLQRFGQSSIPSHVIGTALLRQDWPGAIALILDPRDAEPDQRAAAARQHWKETGDAKAAKEMFPSRYTAERQILEHYSRDTNDHLGAILSVNRELRLMYVHSVQSLLWNRMASRRHRRYGPHLVVGDLVMDAKGIVHVVTETNRVDFSVDNLVLPLPGYQSEYPAHALGAEYREALEELLDTPFDKLASLFKPKQKACWDLPGAYRQVYTRPADLQYRLVPYADPDEPIDVGSTGEDGRSGVSKYRGLFVGFSLPVSCYATMALREMMHTDTDPAQHKAHTKRHRTQ